MRSAYAVICYETLNWPPVADRISLKVMMLIRASIGDLGSRFGSAMECPTLPAKVLFALSPQVSLPTDDFVLHPEVNMWFPLH